MGVLDGIEIPQPYTFGEVLEALAEAIDNYDATKYDLPVAGIPLTDLAAAIQASLGLADSAYQLPVTGIPLADLEAAIQATLGKADTAIQPETAFNVIRPFTITLNGVNPTPVVFGADTAAAQTSTNQAPFDFTGVGSGGTLVFNVDSAEADTATFEATKATSVSGVNAATDITTEVDTKFNISVDGDIAEEVALVVAGLNSGLAIAAAIEAAVQALGGNKATVTCTFADTKYTFTSQTLGTNSSVVITPASSGSITEELKLGIDDGGIETAGTGDVADLSAVTIDEVLAVLTADIAGANFTNDGSDGVTITSQSVGAGSVIIGDGSLNALVGFVQATEVNGIQDMGYATDMANADYQVLATLVGVAQGNLAAKNLSITNKATTGFDVECETAAAAHNVDLLVIGLGA